MRAVDERQQLILERFFRQERTWGLDYYGYRFAAGILLFVAMMLFVIPYQIWEGDHRALGIFLFAEWMGAEQYVKQYCVFREDGTSKSIYETIRYLPISRKQFAWYILKKLLKLCMCLTGTAIVSQVVFATVLFRTFSPANLLVPFLCCLVLPMLLTGSAFVCIFFGDRIRFPILRTSSALYNGKPHSR